MGNTCCKCFSSSSQPLADDHSSAVSPPPSIPTVSSAIPSIPTVSPPPAPIDSVNKLIQQVDPTQLIDLLIAFIEQRIKPSSEASTSSSSAQIIDLDSVASSTDLAAKFINTISSEADRFKGTDVAKEMGNIALRAVKAVGESHWVFLGLSVVAYSLQRVVEVRSIDSKCREVLEKLVDVAKDVKKLREAIPHETEKLSKAVHILVEGAVISCDYIEAGIVSRGSF